MQRETAAVRASGEMNRRQMLKSLGVAAAGAALAGGARAQSKLGPIDVHQHYQEGPANGRWSVNKVLDLMGKNNIATVILSGGSYGDQVYTGNEAGRAYEIGRAHV